MKNENKDDITLKIISMIDKIRPYLIGDGGDIDAGGDASDAIEASEQGAPGEADAA